MFYQIKETLTECTADELNSKEYQYVAVMKREEYEKKADLFDMGIDLDFGFENTAVTRIQVNYDSLTGCFAIPDVEVEDISHRVIFFAIDERGIVFICEDGTAQKMIDVIKARKKWKFPSLERFIYDFLECIVSDDLMLLEKYEKELDKMEDSILDGKLDDVMERIVEIRSLVMDFRVHYEQLMDVAQELEENENNFFSSKKLRFFRLINERVGRLLDIVSSLREHTILIRDLYNAQMEEKQNRNMAYLTVIATIFTPLTLITGWFGMNFRYMPELDQPWAYPLVAVVCVAIAVVSLIIFKKKKWL
ncbi:MAG: magnesium transporter CorA [Lachnospiraceae bacterium]|nr:magnesium transporter CorA [Lachnospiraceae bacterium]